MAAIAADRDLLFGVLALQNGLIDQGQLVAAFQAWMLDKARALADHLVGRGDLDADDRSAVEALVARHLRKHGGDVTRSLAAIPAGRSTRESLARIDDPDVGGTLAHLGSASTQQGEDDDRTASYAVGEATSEGQRFRILRPHAKGGLGAVFVALDGELHREVALKHILDQHADDPTSRARFLLEAEITGNLEHPGIVPVYGLGVYADGRPFYAMRFIRGDSLKGAVDRFHADESSRMDAGRRSLELRKLMRRFTDVCNAIEYAHCRGVLHRDLKPANVIVGKHGETLVVDWGLAKATGRADPGADTGERVLVPSPAGGSAETLPGSAMGTPAFMSPEQAEGDLGRLGPWSDVYSLGATLYYLLTGRPPQEGGLHDVIRAVQRGEFRPPRQVDATIDRALEAVCLKAMAHRPADRYPSCRALAEDIERWVADEPVSAWKEPASVRARRWVRRHRTGATAAAAAVLVALAGLAAVAAVQSRANAHLLASNLNLAAANRATAQALEETQREKEKAEEALAEAQAVRGFLVGAFRSPDPTVDGKDVKVVDILGGAARGLDEGFRGSELTRGAMREALGRTYLGLSLFLEAVRPLEQAAAAREAAQGPDHPDTLDCRVSLVEAYRYAGRLADAVTLGEATRRRSEAKRGPDHLGTLAACSSLAEAYCDAGRTAEAIELQRATLARYEAKQGPDYQGTLASRDRLAEALRTAGRTGDAIALHETNFERRKALLGPSHFDTLTTRGNLANAYLLAGRLPESIALHEENVRLRDAVQGPDNSDTIACRINLALAYHYAGRTREAIPLLEEAYRRYEAKLGPDHPYTLAAGNNLAGAYRATGQPREAIALWEPILKRVESKLGAGHPNTLTARSNLAGTYFAAGRTGDAVALHGSTLPLAEANLGRDHPITLTCRNGLGIALLAAGRTDEGIAMHEETLRLREAKLGADHPDTLNSRDQLAQAYFAAGRRSQAVTLFESTLGPREAKLGPGHPDALLSRNNLANAYEALGRWSEAEALRPRGLARLRESEPPGSPRLAQAVGRLGRDLLALRKWPEAEALLREELAIREKTTPDDWGRHDAMSALGAALAAQGRHADAEPLLVAGYEGMKAREARIPAAQRSRLREAAEQAVRLYEAWGRPARAAAWKTRAAMPDLPADVFTRP